MSDSNQIQGDHNIIIQRISDSSITISINGEVKEIRNELIALRQLMEKEQASVFSVLQNLYNIRDVTDSNFNYITGKKTFNELLTKELISSLETISQPAQKFLTRAKTTPGWEQEANISDIAKDVITYSFVGVIGIQLRKVIAIGKETLSENKQRKYIENCLLTGKRALQLLIFSLVSDLWNIKKDNKVNISTTNAYLLQRFFEDGFEINIGGCFELLKNLLELFATNQLEPSVAELLYFRDHPAELDNLQLTCEQNHILQCSLDTNRYNLLDCFEAEKQLSALLTKFNFLAKYKMISIKNINYDEMRNTPPHYIHQYTSLGIDNKFNINSQRINYVKEPISTDAVLFFKDQYQKSINLFPFVIDMNSLLFEEGSKICFYSSKDFLSERLNFRFLEDNSIENIEYKNILNTGSEINELMMNREKRIQMKLDAVFTQFLEAESNLVPLQNKV